MSNWLHAPFHLASLPTPSTERRGNFLTNWSADLTGMIGASCAYTSQPDVRWVMIQLIVVQVLDDFHSKTRFPAKYKPESLAVCQIAVKKTSKISTPDSQTNSIEDTNRCPAIRNNCRAYRGHVKYIKVSCCFLIQMQRDYITLRFSVWLKITS